MSIVAIPHMGNIYIAFRVLYEGLNIKYVIPPLTSNRTLSLGVSNSPEGVCLPFKLTLGNFLEAVDMGADTLLFTEARGICRLGYYFVVQKEIIKNLGYNINPFTLKEHSFKAFYSLLKTLSPQSSVWRIIHVLRFALAKLKVLDELEKISHRVRPAEKIKGTTTKIYRKGIDAIDKSSTMAELRRAEKIYSEDLLNVGVDGTKLRVGIVGEFFVVLDPFSNLNIEMELGKLGCQAKRTLWLSKWTNFTLFLNPFGITDTKRLHLAAMPYLSRDIGGDGWESVGEKALRVGSLDGIIHLEPFSCLPEITARNIMLGMNGIPTLYITLDEQTGRAGLITRLEAFTDMLKRRKERCGVGV